MWELSKRCKTYDFGTIWKWFIASILAIGDTNYHHVRSVAFVYLCPLARFRVCVHYVNQIHTSLSNLFKPRLVNPGLTVFKKKKKKPGLTGKTHLVAMWFVHIARKTVVETCIAMRERESYKQGSPKRVRVCAFT